MKKTDSNECSPSPFTYQYLPSELLQYPNFCLWRLRWLPEKQKYTKEPITIDGYRASINDPQQRVTFASADWAWRCGIGDGIGFVFTREDPFTFLDLDGALLESPQGAQWNPDLLEILQTFPSWAELSVSGKGVHVIGYGNVPQAIADHPRGVELYGEGRFVALTGWRLTGWPEIVADVQSGVDALAASAGTGKAIRREDMAMPDPGEALSLDDLRAQGVRTDILRFLEAGEAERWHGDVSSAVFAAANELFRRDLEPAAVLGTLLHYCPDFPASHGAVGRRSAPWLWKYHILPAIGSRPPKAGEMFSATSTDSEDQVILTEEALALAFADRHQGRLRYCHTRGLWYEWRGSHWQAETTQLAFSWARDLCREWNRKHSASIAKVRTAAAVEQAARADRRLAVNASYWNAHPWLLATPRGTLDLRTGQLREARPEEHITRCTRVSPEPGRPELWLKFLNEVTQGDLALQRFMQQIAGYCLTGSVREHALVFLYGPGGNGKGVFVDTLTRLMGDYATSAPMGTFAASRQEHHPTEIADLAGARLVTASETEEGHAWAEARIKHLTGGDPIKARFMRRDFFEFMPEFKLVFLGNHRPALRNVDDAARRRFNLVPFTFKPPVTDPDLREKLIAEHGRILHWAVDGCLDWQRNGLQRPECVRLATREYMEEQDLFAQWLADCTRKPEAPRATEAVAALYQSWKFYCERAGDLPGTMKAFSGRLRQRGYSAVSYWAQGHQVRGFEGIKLVGDGPPGNLDKPPLYIVPTIQGEDTP